MAIKITQVPSSQCLIIEYSYNYYAIPLTENIKEALPDIMSLIKVNHENSTRFSVASERPDLKIYVGEVENADN